MLYRPWSSGEAPRLILPPTLFYAGIGGFALSVFVVGLHKTSLGLDLVYATPVGPIRGWQASHAILHFVLAFMAPGLVPVAMLAGVLWEGFEAAMGAMDASAKRKAAREFGLPPPDTAKQWMVGDPTDIAFNAVGAMSGLTACAMVGSLASLTRRRAAK
jgi:hypothetical protein